jgi:hypothetical protein
LGLCPNRRGSPSSPARELIPWTHFGAGFVLQRKTKASFLEAFSLAMAVYPEASVDVEKGGIILNPSVPAVPKAEARRLGIA